MKELLAKISPGNIASGAVLIIALGFGFGIVTFSGSAEKAAALQSKNAVIDALTPFCLAAAQADPLHAERVAELKALSSYKRSDKMKEFGWATLPGSDTMNMDVARSCTTKLIV